MSRSTQAQFERYHQLVEVLASLARNSHEVEAVVQTVHAQAGTLFPAQITLLALLKPDGDWRWEMYEGEQRSTQVLPFYTEGVLERVLHGEALLIQDLYGYLKEHSLRARRILSDSSVILDIGAHAERPSDPSLSLILVPLEVQGRRIGVLSIQSYEVGAFDDTDLQFLCLLAQHVAIALGNAALREASEQLIRTDALTGLLNRRAFHQDAQAALDTARQEGKSLSLVMLDVHEFKQINDRFGHQTGDAVLVTLGNVLKQTLSVVDAVFRLGGDELVLLVWGPSGRLSEMAVRLAYDLRAAAWPPGVGPIRLHGGWAQSSSAGDLEDWLALADAQMYRAKRRRSGEQLVDWGVDFGEAAVAGA